VLDYRRGCIVGVSLTRCRCSRAAALLERFPSWAKTYRSEDGAARLAADAVDVLCAFKLAAREEGAVRARPAAARFAVATPVVQE
jgi:hypothetical protein